MFSKKSVFGVVAYIVGMFLLAIGTAFMAKADFGMSMVVAPAYLLHLKISQYLPFFSFGMAEYCLQAVLLVALIVAVRGFKINYLFSFVTAVCYGFILDFAVSILSGIRENDFSWRIVFFLSGILMCCLGVAFMLRSFFAPEVYELFVKEFSAKYNLNIGSVKTVYDCASCLLSIALSFLFFGFENIQGINYGTIFSALVNGFLIARFGKIIDLFFPLESSSFLTLAYGKN